MFPYLFPIFCFGLVMAGIVVLGIIRAADQAKFDDDTPDPQSDGQPMSAVLQK
jgi:hypothetical protein